MNKTPAKQDENIFANQKQSISTPILGKSYDDKIISSTSKITRTEQVESLDQKSLKPSTMPSDNNKSTETKTGFSSTKAFSLQKPESVAKTIIESARKAVSSMKGSDNLTAFSTNTKVSARKGIKSNSTDINDKLDEGAKENANRTNKTTERSITEQIEQNQSCGTFNHKIVPNIIVTSCEDAIPPKETTNANSEQVNKQASKPTEQMIISQREPIEEEEIEHVSIPMNRIEDLVDYYDEDYDPYDSKILPKSVKTSVVAKKPEHTEANSSIYEAKKWDLKEELALVTFCKANGSSTSKIYWVDVAKQKKIPECEGRSGEALRSRYKDFLIHLTQAEIDQMKNYFEEHGNGIVSYKCTTTQIDGKKKHERHVVSIQPDLQDKVIVPRNIRKTAHNERTIAKAEIEFDSDNSNLYDNGEFTENNAEKDAVKVVTTGDHSSNALNGKNRSKREIGHILTKKYQNGSLLNGANSKPLDELENRKRKYYENMEARTYEDLKKSKPLEEIWNNQHKVSKIFDDNSMIQEYPNLPADKLTIFIDFEKKSRKTVVYSTKQQQQPQQQQQQQQQEQHQQQFDEKNAKVDQNNTKPKKEQSKLMTFAKQYQMSYEEIKEIFFRVSGNYDNLKEVLQNGNEVLIWTPEQDEDLKDAVNNQRLLKYLISEKGEQNVLQRRQFLQDIGHFNDELDHQFIQICLEDI